MNIETLIHHIALFQKDIVNSGFKRDIDDYVSSLPSNESNIVALREVAEKCKDYLSIIYNSDLPNALSQLFPQGKIKPFTDTNHFDIISDLLNDKEIQVVEFFNKLTTFLNQLNNQLQQNITEADELEIIFMAYYSKDKKILTEENKAIIAILFKDVETVTSLKQFSKTIGLWNRTLPLYQQIISSISPEDIEIIEVQNGSIDFIINIDFDVAINLAELFKIGFKCYLGYLSYKSLIKPISDTYFGNKKLIASETEREKELLNNIALSISKAIIKQNKVAKKSDKAIDDKIDKKVDQVTKLITAHIIRGNDIKLLSLPQIADEGDNSEEDINESKNELEQVSLEVRNAIREIPPDEIKLLMEKYGEINEE